MYKRVPVSLHWLPGFRVSRLRRRADGASAAACRRRAPRAQAPQLTAPQRPVAATPAARPGSGLAARRPRSVLRRLPQRKTENGEPAAGQGRSRAPRGSSGYRREGRAENAGRDDAAFRHAAAGCRHLRETDRLDGDAARRERHPASAPAGHSSSQPRRIRERDPRPARAGSGSPPSSSRRTIRRPGSTTSPARCGCRPR